jgi:hypothetical protein
MIALGGATTIRAQDPAVPPPDDPIVAEYQAACRSLTDDGLTRYARYRRAVLRGLDSWNDKKEAAALKAAGLTKERAGQIGGVVEGYYKVRFMVRQAELESILLRAQIEGCHGKKPGCPEADLARWAELQGRLREADRERAGWAERYGREVQVLLDRREETYLELVALMLGMTWGRSPDPSVIQAEARRPLEEE